MHYKTSLLVGHHSLNAKVCLYCDPAIGEELTITLTWKKEETRMEFCPKCESRLGPTKTRTETGETLLLFACPRCGYTKQATHKKTEEKPNKAEECDPHQEILTVIAKEDEVNTMPTIRVECPKCGNNLVYVWQVQTRGGDEASTQFFRCTKCNHTFREYT